MNKIISIQDNERIISFYDISKVSFVTKVDDRQIHMVVDGFLNNLFFVNKYDRDKNFEQIHNLMMEYHNNERGIN